MIGASYIAHLNQKRSLKKVMYDYVIYCMTKNFDISCDYIEYYMILSFIHTAKKALRQFAHLISCSSKCSDNHMERGKVPKRDKAACTHE